MLSSGFILKKNAAIETRNAIQLATVLDFNETKHDMAAMKKTPRSRFAVIFDQAFSLEEQA